MTLLAGIKCSDGVVLGADGAATYRSFGAANHQTTPPKKAPKDWTRNHHWDIRTSRVGSEVRRGIGVAQERQCALCKILVLLKICTNRLKLCQILREHFWKYIEVEGNIAKSSAPLFRSEYHSERRQPISNCAWHRREGMPSVVGPNRITRGSNGKSAIHIARKWSVDCRSFSRTHPAAFLAGSTSDP